MTKGDALLFCLLLKDFQDTRYQIGRLQAFPCQADIARFQVRESEKVVDQSPEPFGVALDDGEKLLRLAPIGGGAAPQGLRLAADGGERSAQLMGDIGNKIGPYALPSLP